MLWDVRTAAFILLLTAASVGDLRHREIPKGVIPGLFLTGLFCFDPLRLFGVLAAAPIFIFALIWKDRMGFGDVWLTTAASFVVGFQHGLWAQIIAYVALLFFYAGNRLRRKKKPDAKVPEEPYPIAPFLALGLLAAYFL